MPGLSLYLHDLGADPMLCGFVVAGVSSSGRWASILRRTIEGRAVAGVK